MCTIGKCSGSKILMNGEIDSFYLKDYTLSTGVKPCFLYMFSKRTWNKCLLETNFASGVKLSSITLPVLGRQNIPAK